MILGFTGTRCGMTLAQYAALPSVIAALPERVLHGGAEGADEEFDAYLRPRWVGEGPFVEVYPVGQLRYHFWTYTYAGEEARLSLLYYSDDPLIRNRIIAERCDHLLACPAEPDEQLRSGTWATVRYARKAGKPRTLLLPNGTVREER